MPKVICCKNCGRVYDILFFKDRTEHPKVTEQSLKDPQTRGLFDKKYSYIPEDAADHCLKKGHILTLRDTKK